MAMTRHPDWRKRLVAYLLAVEGRAFDPADWHCVHFASGAVLAMTGRDMMAEVTRARTRAGQRRALRRRDLDDWPAAFPELHIPATAMREGDVAVLQGDDGHAAAGICLGAEVKAFGPTGLSIVPRTAAQCGLRV